VFRRVGAGWTARRLLQGRLERTGAHGRRRARASLAEFSARMVDRVGLLTPRLALAGKEQDLQASDALRDLRIGLNMTLLQPCARARPRRGGAVGPLMNSCLNISRCVPPSTRCERACWHARQRPARGLRRRARRAQREALAALTGMRRDLFPQGGGLYNLRS
jgi:hypothetical protein